MAKNLIRRRTTLLMVTLGVWSLALMVVGILSLQKYFGAIVLGAGLLSATVVVLGILRRFWVAPMYGVALIAAVGSALVGSIGDPLFIGLGILGIVVVGATAPIAFLLNDHASRGASGAEPTGMAARLQRIEEHTMLSDNAKRVLFRDRELGLLRNAIEDDIHQGKYNAALRLCAEMADAFGYREEAEEFRQRIAQSRRTHFEVQVQTALDQLDTLLARRDWAHVHQEAARIRRLFGESHLVADLDHRIRQARDDHKQELEKRFLEAAGKEDVEQAMSLLKELDRYIDRDDAGRLSTAAEDVVIKHRQNLGTQFKLAVADHRWAEAARIGEGIVDEFPNSKMAVEVRAMIDVLRTRASQAAVTSEGEPR